MSSTIHAHTVLDGPCLRLNGGCCSVATHAREQREQLAEAQRIANVGSWEYDFITGRRTYSEQFCRIFGLDPGEEADPDRLNAIIHPDDRARALRMQRMAHETLQPVAEQFRLALPDGAMHTVVLRVRALLDDDGQPLRLVGVVQDITERVTREEELRRVAVQQAAVANLGQMALSGASLDFLFTQVTALLTNVLAVDFCQILQRRHGGELALVAGTPPPARPIVSGLTVAIGSAEDRPWGILGVHTAESRSFGTTDGDFLRSVAAVLAQAIARNRADEELRTRALQQSAIAEIGRAVLTKLDAETLDRACQLVARGLRVEKVTFVPGETPDDAGIAVASAEQTFGALVVRPPRNFTEDDYDFVQTVANILAEAMEREQAKESHQQLTRSLQLLLESTLGGICTIDADGRCTMVNAAAARMLGRRAEEMLGANIDRFVRAEGDLLGAPQSVINALFERADGTQVPVDYSAAPIVDAGATVGAVLAFTDITERRKLELKLEQANRLSSLGRLAATVAHEFNNVLMGISPFVEVIRRKPERAAFALEQIAGAISRGKRVTGEILRFARPAELVCAAIDVEPWLRDVVAALPPPHRVRVDVADPSLRVYADRNQLHQVFANLFSNARDAMPDGGTIAIAASREERFVHFTVADSGCGMSAETLQHIFEPLFTTKSSGTGLGLAVAHQVVQRHGGDIFAESVAGAGTTFHLFIPVANGESAALPAPAPPPKPSPARHLLLVDDDEAVVAGLVALIELEGMKVDAVRTGAAAIDYLRHTTPDIVLLDVGLPDIDGTEVYAHIDPAVPVIFSTGHADTARLDDLREHRQVISLLKPYDLATLLDAIERACIFSPPARTTSAKER